MEQKEVYYQLGIASGFAAAAHINQKRKYTGEPYVNHCLDVMTTLGQFTNDLPSLSAAVLHDVLEDTPITSAQLLHTFGLEITNLVIEVTDVSRFEDGNRKVRKEIDRQHLAKSSHRGASIKLADLISNTKSIVKHDHNFAVVYLREKKKLLEILKHGNTSLWELANKTLEDALKELKNES